MDFGLLNINGGFYLIVFFFIWKFAPLSGLQGVGG